MERYRILALDGGDRGLLVVLILLRLLGLRPRLLDNVKLFAGTSSGSVIAGILVNAPSPAIGVEQAITFWNSWDPFEGVSFFSLHSALAVAGLTAIASRDKMIESLHQLFGDRRLGDLRRGFLSTSFCLYDTEGNPTVQAWKVDIQHNLVAGLHDQTRLIDAVLRSSAAPIMYPIYQGHLDGGIFASNPSLVAATAVVNRLGIDIHNIEVLSVGEGKSNTAVSLGRADIGYAQWLLDPNDPMILLDVVADANLQSTEHVMTDLLADRFVRYNPPVDPELEPLPGSSMTDYCRKLEALAYTLDLEPLIESLDKLGWW